MGQLFDASIISAQFKPGTVLAQVNARSFDDEEFKKCVGEAADHSDFIEILVMNGKPDEGHFVTGEIVFVDVGQNSPEFFYAEENGTKFSNEVSFLQEGEKLLSVGMSEKMAESDIDEEIKPKYKVGDELTYINDYCVNWGLRTITDMVQDKWGWNYYISPTETPWCPVREKNLYVPGTEPTFELELNNGMTVKLVETDWNGNRYYDIGGKKAVLTDGFLYSTVSDWEEACCRLDEQFQPNTEKMKLSMAENEKKCDNQALPEAETVETATGNDYFSPRSTDNKQTNPLHSTKPRR